MGKKNTPELLYYFYKDTFMDFFSWKKKEFVLAQMYLSKVQLVQIDPHCAFFEQFASSLGSCMAPKISVKLYD